MTSFNDLKAGAKVRMDERHANVADNSGFMSMHWYELKDDPYSKR